MRRTLYLETFGCQMNELDSELVLTQLRARGYESTDDRQQADVILYNTCSVREHAEQKVWSRLGEMRNWKQTKPHLVIGVIGCMAERDGTNIFQRFPHVDLLCGPGELDKLAMMIDNLTTVGNQLHSERQVALMGSRSRRSSTLAAAHDNLELLDLSRSFSPTDNAAQAYVRITRGCNKFCTYCVVPYTRGPEVHRPPENIIEEVRRLADAGVLEVTLLGQTINHYRYDHGDGRITTFGQLLYQIHEAASHLPRLRFVTSFPRDFEDEALQAMRDCPRICRYLHVPAQHGSDRILKLMNRGYTAEQYLQFIGRARAYMPDISLASDFIVGFPTETDQEFQTCKEVIRQCRFKNSFIFKYSLRPGTTAITRFEDDVPPEVKKQRNNELLDVQAQVCDQNNREMVGRQVEVMVEGQSKLASRWVAGSGNGNQVELGWEKRQKSQDADQPKFQLSGRTRGDQIVVFDGDPALVGQLVEVDITRSKTLTLFGRLTRDRRPVTAGV
ncbi:MAG: tRNA (N6-isopentenyl adenosine(37)-C2)-methylthiotransferase MiaB [Phycisphaerales bacterium]|nr:tRNA (N6-isopentenyl adenosine(37)-C2)-methylthiotransferase MiaB [Phycisphaerales bacterium]